MSTAAGMGREWMALHGMRASGPAGYTVAVMLEGWVYRESMAADLRCIAKACSGAALLVEWGRARASHMVPGEGV